MLVCLTLSSYAQLVNEVDVYVRPNTEVHIFENMTNANTGSFTVDEEGLLYVDGTLVNNGSMTFENAASLLRGNATSDGTGNGMYYVRRQGSNNLGVYNYWSSPMEVYSGVPGSQNYLYDPVQGTQTYTDDQPADPGWIAHSGNMEVGRGYAGRGGGLHTFNGDVSNGDESYTLYYTSDIPGNTNQNTPFNLVGNPYPSGVSCAALVSANSDISGALYFWDDDLSGGSGYSNTDYAVWNGTGSLGTGSGNQGAPNGVISTGQGFKVKATSPGAVLNFTNAMRVANTTQFFRAAGDNSRMWFSVGNEDYFNQILIGVLDDATDGEDRLYDATKLRGNQDISLAAYDALLEKEYCIYAFPQPAYEKIVPLNVFINEAGTYTFKPEIMENFQFTEVFFVDNQTGDETELFEGTEITLSLPVGEINGRFFLNFRSDGNVTGIDRAKALDVNIYSYDDMLYLSSNMARGKNAQMELFDMSGRLVMAKENVMLSSNPTTFSLNTLSRGVYSVRILLDGESFNTKIVRQ